MATETKSIPALRRSRRLRRTMELESMQQDVKRKRTRDLGRVLSKTEAVPVKVEDKLSGEGAMGQTRKKRSLNLKELVKMEEELLTEDKKGRVRTKKEKREKKVKREGDVLADIEESCLPIPDEVEQVIELLSIKYGSKRPKFDHPKTKPKNSVLDSLISTILSQNTTNINSSRAFRSLKAAFPTWEDALDAKPSDIEDSIRAGGLAQIKAARIHTILKTIQAERGELNLEYIRDLQDEEAKEVLCRFKGVGPKTASCVLMFNLGRGEFPVDTHVRRLTGRLGWVPEESTAERVYEKLNKVLDDKHKFKLHVLLVTHGRRTCRPQNPRCDECPLLKRCNFGRKQDVDYMTDESQ